MYQHLRLLLRGRRSLRWHLPIRSIRLMARPHRLRRPLHNFAKHCFMRSLTSFPTCLNNVSCFCFRHPPLGESLVHRAAPTSRGHSTVFPLRAVASLTLPLSSPPCCRVNIVFGAVRPRFAGDELQFVTTPTRRGLKTLSYILHPKYEFDKALLLIFPLRQSPPLTVSVSPEPRQFGNCPPPVRSPRPVGAAIPSAPILCSALPAYLPRTTRLKMPAFPSLDFLPRSLARPRGPPGHTKATQGE